MSYKIIFCGELRPGVEQIQVQQRLATALKIKQVDQLDHLFQGTTHTLKRDINYRQARTIHDALYKIGAVCTIEKITNFQNLFVYETANDSV